MENVTKILAAKGYDNEEENQIIYQGYLDYESLDQQVRYQFNITEPVHLWDGYYIGDSNEEELNEKAEENGYADYQELFSAMDARLLELIKQFPVKG